jgi:hypothetical protein
VIAPITSAATASLARHISTANERHDQTMSDDPKSTLNGVQPDRRLSHLDRKQPDREPDPEYGFREPPQGKPLPPSTYQPR